MESSVRDPVVKVHVILISVQVRIGCVLFGKLMLWNPTLFTVSRCHFCLQASKINTMSLLKTLKLIKKLRSLFHRHHDCIINALEHHSGTLPSIKPRCSKESEASAATHLTIIYVRAGYVCMFVCLSVNSSYSYELIELKLCRRNVLTPT